MPAGYNNETQLIANHKLASLAYNLEWSETQVNSSVFIDYLSQCFYNHTVFFLTFSFKMLEFSFMHMSTKFVTYSIKTTQRYHVSVHYLLVMMIKQLL